MPFNKKIKVIAAFYYTILTFFFLATASLHITIRIFCNNCQKKSELCDINEQLRVLTFLIIQTFLGIVRYKRSFEL